MLAIMIIFLYYLGTIFTMLSTRDGGRCKSCNLSSGQTHSWMSRDEEACKGTALASQSPSLEDPVPFSSPLSFNQDELHFFVCCSFVLTFTNTEQAPLGACLVSSLQNQVGQSRFKNQETWSSEPLSH